MILDGTRLGTSIERQVIDWNTHQIEPEEICVGCQQEIEDDHDVRECIQRTYVYADEVGEFGTKVRTNEDNKSCVVQKKKPHTHDTCDEMRKCFANHLKKYHQQRKRQWQRWCEPRAAELVGAECSKCGCFWTGHDTTACQVIGTFNNNLRFFLSTLPPYCVRLAKRVLDQQPERSHRYAEATLSDLRRGRIPPMERMPPAGSLPRNQAGGRINQNTGWQPQCNRTLRGDHWPRRRNGSHQYLASM